MTSTASLEVWLRARGANRTASGRWRLDIEAADRITQLEADNASLVETQGRNNETIENLIAERDALRQEVAALKAALKDAQALLQDKET